MPGTCRGLVQGVEGNKEEGGMQQKGEGMGEDGMGGRQFRAGRGWYTHPIILIPFPALIHPDP